MPKICYEPKRFNAEHAMIIERVNSIIDDYAAQGYDLTLRQIYYQFVSRDWLPNRQQEYKRLGTIVSAGRRAGLIDWNAVVDRTRHVRTHAAWDSPADIVRACSDQYSVDMWINQDYRPEVWVEKDALVGVLQVACDQWKVPYFSCRGFASDSEMWGAAQRLRRHAKGGHQTVIFHLGDHDPSGVDMTRDIEDRLHLFGAPQSLMVKRIALNMDQIEQYQPPPNPAKETDSRFAKYQEEFGDESWELDALNPETITQLIGNELMKLRDHKVWEADLARQDQAREELATIADNFDAAVAAVQDEE